MGATARHHVRSQTFRGRHRACYRRGHPADPLDRMLRALLVRVLLHTKISRISERREGPGRAADAERSSKRMKKLANMCLLDDSLNLFKKPNFKY